MHCHTITCIVLYIDANSQCNKQANVIGGTSTTARSMIVTSLSQSEFAFVKLIDNTLRQSTYCGKIFYVRSMANNSRGKCLYFGISEFPYNIVQDRSKEASTSKIVCSAILIQYVHPIDMDRHLMTANTTLAQCHAVKTESSPRQQPWPCPCTYLWMSQLTFKLIHIQYTSFLHQPTCTTFSCLYCLLSLLSSFIMPKGSKEHYKTIHNSRNTTRGQSNLTKGHIVVPKQNRKQFSSGPLVSQTAQLTASTGGNSAYRQTIGTNTKLYATIYILLHI